MPRCWRCGVIGLLALAVTPMVGKIFTPSDARSCSEAIHYDFVEVGTSDFNTLLQQTGPAARGLSVDPMRVHLQSLPDRYLKTKVHAAIGEASGVETFFYVDPADISSFKLPWWLKGCTMVGKPHPVTMSELSKRGLERLMKNHTVQMVTLKGLLHSYCARSVGYLKVDTEGFDTTIMHSFLEVLDQGLIAPPQQIRYESNWLDAARRSAVRDVNRHLVNKYGYRHSWTGPSGPDEPSDASIRKWCTHAGEPQSTAEKHWHCGDQVFMLGPR